MPTATLVSTKGQQLKKTLGLLFQSPEQFDVSPVCQPDSLRRLLGEQHAPLVGDRLSPRELAMEGLKRLTARFVAGAARQNDVRLAEGLMLIWYQYLEPILSGSARSMPSVARVLIHCAQPNHQQEFWRTIEKAYGRLDLSAQGALLFRDLSVNRHELERAARQQRRTYVNHIHRAFETLARRSELSHCFEAGSDDPAAVEASLTDQAAPSGGSPSGVVETLVGRRSMLDLAVAHVLARCQHLPLACGRTLPTAMAIERAVEVLPVKGAPLCPDLRLAESVNVSRLSGVLAGVPGSGRTAFLYQVAHSWAGVWTPGRPLAFYVRAPEFLVYARNRRSIHEFAARQVLPAGSRDEIELLRKELEEYEQAGGVLWLVDEMDRLATPDQSEVILQMAFSPAMFYAALPWETARIARQLPTSNTGLFRLSDLSKAQQKEMLTRFSACYVEADVSLPIGALALTETPYLARLPLGVAAVFDQLLTGVADRVHITRRALDEYFERAGLPHPQFAGDWLTLDPTVRALLVMATVVGADILWYGDEGLFTPRARFEQGNGWTPESHWELLVQTRLFEPHPKYPQACRFFNWDILSYLIAKSEAAPLFAHIHCELVEPLPLLLKLLLHIQSYAIQVMSPAQNRLE